jgi:hypothetical protein
MPSSVGGEIEQPEILASTAAEAARPAHRGTQAVLRMIQRRTPSRFLLYSQHFLTAHQLQ